MESAERVSANRRGHRRGALRRRRETESRLTPYTQHLPISLVGGGVIGRSSFTYRISDSGRERANLFLEHNHYVGASPVPLSQYQTYMEQVENEVE